MNRSLRTDHALFLHSEQSWNARAVDVNIEHGNALTALGQIDSEAGGHGALPDAALPGENEDLVLDV